MKITAFCIILSFLLLPLLSISQTAGRNEDLVSWHPENKLTWNDYKAKPDPTSDAAASTTTYLTISYNISSSDFSYKIESRFSRTRSWGLYKTPYILSHEQGHFDIAEIFARKLHKKMIDYRFDKKDYEKDLKQIYQEILDEKKEMQDDYDRETNHSINKEKQEEWLRKIEKLLNELDDYKDY